MKYIKKYNESSKTKFPNIKKIEMDGFIIYIGKDAKSNDYLTFNIANDEDIWMHAKGYPGSHVVIKVRNNIPMENVIKNAALMAKKNSKASKIDNVDIVYCQRKFVKKKKGMNDGQVEVDYINSYKITV